MRTFLRTLFVVSVGGAAVVGTASVADDPATVDIVERWTEQANARLGGPRSLGEDRGVSLVPVSELGLEGEGEVLTGENVPRVDVRVRFALDSAVLEATEAGSLLVICDAMTMATSFRFHVIGHTDSIGSDSYNMDLSKRRAEEVRRYLVEECDIPADRLNVLAAGERLPLDPDNPEADENRRVEFQVSG